MEVTSVTIVTIAICSDQVCRDLNGNITAQQCGVNRVWRLMKRVGIKAQVGYRSLRVHKGEVSIVSPNRLQRQFNPDAPNERWVPSSGVRSNARLR